LNWLSKLKFVFVFLLKFIIRKKSSAYALNYISLCRDMMLDNFFNAMRNSITDMNEPWGIPLNRGNVFDVCGPTLLDRRLLKNQIKATRVVCIFDFVI